MLTPRPYKTISRASHTGNPYEAHALINNTPLPAGRTITQSSAAYFNTVISSARQFLPFAAEAYNISSKMEDFVFVPTVIMPSDIPNTNDIAFPYEQLTRFNLETGTVAYKTWVNKPTFVEHDSSNYKAARGIVFDTRFFRTNYPGIWKVSALLGFDRNKDPALVAGILRGVKDSYSMGAFVRDYECSICGRSLAKGGCEHLTYMEPRANIFMVSGKPKLAYYKVVDMLGAEVSSVAVPAYYSASDSHPIFPQPAAL